MVDSTLIKLKRLDGYRFEVEFEDKSLNDMVVDEDAPIGEGLGPNPTELLSMAVGHCLSSSLLFCLSKSRVEVKDLESSVELFKERNSEGRLRIKNMEVRVKVNADEEDEGRLKRCLGIFENYCTVTQSVRTGINVNVVVDTN